MTSKPAVQGYSFYLNVVVIDSAGRPVGDESGDDEKVVDVVAVSKDDEEAQQEAAKEESPVSQEEPSPEPSSEKGRENDDGGAVVPVGTVRDTKTTDPKIKLLMEGRSLVDSVFNNNRMRRQKSNENGSKLVQDGQRFMNSIGSSISRSGTNISKRASRFVASKTMVSRAEKAVGESIPLVQEEIGVEMSISKRFQQGPVFVLEVDMKGCDLLDLLEKVLGGEQAKHYRNVKEGLETLDLPNTKEGFLKEILPKVRKAMMDRMSEIVPEKMKLKKQYADLEIQCVALEDAEEAKWLYNFLAFMEQMK